MIFTVVAYRENSVDTCRGCVMERTDSDLDMLVSNDAHEVAKFIAPLYNSHEINIFVNGFAINCASYVRESIYADNEDFDDLEQAAYAILARAKELADEWRELERQAAEALERKKAEDYQRQRREQDLAELKRLQKEYGNG